MATQTEILQGKVINAYLKASGLHVFSQGPHFAFGIMQKDFEWLWDHADKLSHGERLVFQVAQEIWNWDAQVKIFDLVNGLPPELITLTFSLYQAWADGPAALEFWITKISKS